MQEAGLAPEIVSSKEHSIACSHPAELGNVNVQEAQRLSKGTVIDIWNFSFKLPAELDQLKPVNLQCDISEMVFLEIFAGSGNLSKDAREVGYRIHPVDSTTKRQTGVAMHVLDLTCDSDAYVLLDLACNANIASGHLAPPCGTASRSRERRLPEELSHIKSLPLRSEEYPPGTPMVTEPGRH